MVFTGTHSQFFKRTLVGIEAEYSTGSDMMERPEEPYEYDPAIPTNPSQPVLDDSVQSTASIVSANVPETKENWPKFLYDTSMYLYDTMFYDNDSLLETITIFHCVI